MEEQPRNLEELLLNDSFVRWIRDISDEHETTYWENWIDQDPKNEKLVEEAKKIVQSMKFQEVDTSDLEQELNKLNTTIDTDFPIHDKPHRPRHRRSTIFRYVAAAAMVLIIFSAGFFVLDGQFDFSPQHVAEVPIQTTIQEQVIKASDDAKPTPSSDNVTKAISTKYAQKSTVIFDDGSKVVLNANSTLEYPAGNTESRDITVKLEGEAYFDIAKKKSENKRTFTVQTESGSVQVLGTKFSVQTHDDHTQVALQEGVVEVNRKGISDSNNLTYRMEPGQIAQFSKISSDIEVDEINTEVYFSWTENELRFDNTPLSEIIQRIENTYGVIVVVEDQSLMDRKISGSIQNNDLDVLLRALSELLQIPIQRNRTTITIDT